MNAFKGMAALILWISLLVATTAHREDRQLPDLQVPAPAPQRFSLNYSMISFTLDLSTNHLPSGNRIFSPLSIATMLNLLLLGTTGNTYEQLRYVLKYPFPVDDLLIHQMAGIQLRQLKTSGVDQQARVRIASRIFTDAGLPVEEAFRQDIDVFYMTSVEQLQFGRQPTVATQRINSWINEATTGKIPQLFDSPLARNTRMVGANVVYFKGAWETPFNPDDTMQLTFHSGDGQSVRTDMMFGQMMIPFREFPDQGFRAASLPYKGGKFSMLLLLPDQRGEKHVDDLERTLSPEKIYRIVSQLQVSDILVWVPKFKLEQTLSLREVLQEMGATDIFQESRASLRSISSDRRLFLNEVLHQAVIEVDEEGTEAAAATVTLINRDRFSREFRANRPFLFVVRDNDSGVPLFWGRFVRPEA